MVDGCLARVGGQNLLFSPTHQQLFALNDTAAEIWRSLEKGDRPERIASDLVDRGADARDANLYVESAFREWMGLDLIRPSPPPATAAPDCLSQLVALPGLRARIIYSGADCSKTAEVFRHLETAGATAEVQFQAVELHGRFHLFRNDAWLLSCAPEELATAIKGQLLDEILSRGNYEIALHAASLTLDDRALLLFGSPGAGKTTLAMALVRAGMGFAADDVTLLHSDGAAVGLPFAPALKPGAWPILAHHFSGIEASPVFRRPDRKRVRYFLPAEPVRQLSSQVAWVVMLRRSKHAEPGLERIDAASAFRGMLDGSFAAGRALTGSAFDTLIRTIASADVRRLTYWSLDDAVDLLTKACR